jgi:predicted transcriptional regulator
MSTTITLRLNDDFKKKIEAKAREKNKSMNQLINELLTFSSLIEELTDEQSKIVIRDAKGFKPDQEVVVPHPDKLYA